MYLLFGLLLIVYYSNKQQMDFWLTDPQRNILFQQQPPISPSKYEKNIEAENIIEINPNEQYQSIDGFGCALTDGNAFHLYHLDNTTRASILEELFRTDKNNIGISYLECNLDSASICFD
jgi:glucosylceramidase